MVVAVNAQTVKTISQVLEEKTKKNSSGKPSLDNHKRTKIDSKMTTKDPKMLGPQVSTKSVSSLSATLEANLRAAAEGGPGTSMCSKDDASLSNGTKRKPFVQIDPDNDKVLRVVEIPAGGISESLRGQEVEPPPCPQQTVEDGRANSRTPSPQVTE